MGPLAVTDDSPANYDEDLIVKPKTGLNRANNDYKYTLETSGTNATTVESFSSSSEENTAYSDENEESQLEGGEFLDLAYEASRQPRRSIRGHKYFNLVGESNDVEDDRDDNESEQYTQPETVEFVDSEDGEVFHISQKPTKRVTAKQIGILQKVRSLDDSNTLATDACSKTLNTNAEYLKEMPSMNEDDLEEMRMSNRMNKLRLDVEHNEYDDEEEFEAIEIEDSGGYEYEDDYEHNDYEHTDYDHSEYTDEHDDYHGEDPEPQQNHQRIYDCDDGDMYYAQEGVTLHGQDEEGTVFSQLRIENSGHSRDYHTHPSSMGVVEEEVQAGQWASVANQVHYENEHHAHNHHELEDPYLSDGNSSWEEGSFATGASRTLSRVDSADDDHEEVETYQTFEGSYYSDEDSQEERDDRPMVRMLKKVRSNLEPERPGERSGEREQDDYDKKKRSRNRRRRRKNKKSHWIVESVREIGTDVLDEAIEFAESKDKAETMINSFANLFSCGGNY